jgi:hypothetical protein
VNKEALPLLVLQVQMYKLLLSYVVNDDDVHKPFSTWGIDYFTKTHSATTAVVDPLNAFLCATQDNSEVYCVYEEGHECTHMEFQKALKKFCDAEKIYPDIKREMEGQGAGANRVHAAGAVHKHLLAPMQALRQGRGQAR